MEKTIKLLAVVLGAQLLLALGLGLADRGLSARSEAEPLLAVAKEKIDRITLEEPHQTKVVLAKKNGAWQLTTEAGDFPADDTRLAALLDRLTELKGGAPVGTTAGAQARFKVSDEAFERRITLASGEEQLARLYLGTSPGMRRIHVRIADQSAIHAVELAAHDVPVKTVDWQDNTVLRIPKEEISAIEVAGLHFERMHAAATPEAATANESATAPAPAWEAKGVPPGQRPKPDAVEKLAELLADLRIGEVLGKEAKDDYGLAKPLMELTATRKNGDTLTYLLGKAADKEEYTLKISNRPEYFRLPGYTANPLVEAGKREALIETSPASNRGKAGSAAAQKR